MHGPTHLVSACRNSESLMKYGVMEDVSITEMYNLGNEFITRNGAYGRDHQHWLKVVNNAAIAYSCKQSGPRQGMTIGAVDKCFRRRKV